MSRCSDAGLENSPLNKSAENALRRAALISRDIDSVTLGPDSSFSLLNDELDSPRRPSPLTEKQQENLKSTKKSTPPRKSSHLITVDEIHAMQDQYSSQVKKREIDVKVRKQMEERLKAETEHYHKIQQKLEAARVAAEKKHEQRMEELNRKMQAAMRQQDQEEREYKKQFQEKVENSRKILEQQENELREAMKKHEDNFNQLELVFMRICQSCPTEMSPLIEEYKKNLNILKTKKSTAKSPGEMKSLCVALDEVNRSLQKMREMQIKSQKENEERQKAEDEQKEEQRVQAEANAARESAAIAAAAAAQAQVQVQPANNAQSETDQIFMNFQRLLAAKINDTHNLNTTKELEQLRFRLKVTINSAINTLERTQKSTLVENFQKLKCLLSGQNLNTERGPISTMTHPEAADWTILRIADKLINISGKKCDDVFVYASVTVALWQEFPMFGEIVLALLYKECPYLAALSPALLPKSGDLACMGYKNDERTGAFEDHTVYFSRTTKYAAFMAAIWISNGPSGRNLPHPFGIDNAWKYLSTVLNFPPNAHNVHVIDQILKIAGPSLQLAYGKQFVKLVKIMFTSYLPNVLEVADKDTKGYCSQLQTTIETFMRNSRFDEPKGKLPLNYW